MYSRNFFTDEKNSPTPPENYSGTALTEESPESEEYENVSSLPKPDCTDECISKRCEEPSSGLFSGILSGGFSNIFGKGGIKSIFSHIGTEEIIIIAVAMFLLFSKEGDKECAIMLLLLLIV